jgi:hypothetical protein
VEEAVLLGQARAERRFERDAARLGGGHRGAERRHEGLAGEAVADAGLPIGIGWLEAVQSQLLGHICGDGRPELTRRRLKAGEAIAYMPLSIPTTR